MAIGHAYPGAHLYQHGNCGMPFRGSTRRRAPKLLAVHHITGNASLPSALAEMKYSARAGSGASFPFAINRNGSVVQGYDPVLYAPWTNGDLRSPDMSNPVIAGIVRAGSNPNEDSFVTTESVGAEPGAPITDAQVETMARIDAWAWRQARAQGWYLPIDAIRIIGHQQINSITRAGCPTRNNWAGLRARIVARAAELVAPPAPVTPPAEEEEEVDFTKAQYQIPKIVRVKGGVTLFRSPDTDEVHWVVPADGAFDAELLRGFGKRWMGSRAPSTEDPTPSGLFFADFDAIDRTVEFKRYALFDDQAVAQARRSGGIAVADAARDKANTL